MTWRKLKAGLPEGHVGKIGLAVTPAAPGLVYATIEAGEDEKGFYRSDDQGETWQKKNNYISGGTGPHYYQDIEASTQSPLLVKFLFSFQRWKQYVAGRRYAQGTRQVLWFTTTP